MRWYTKRNKQKVWSKTYGKGIIRKDILWRVMAQSVASAGQAQLSAIMAAPAVTDEEIMKKKLSAVECVAKTIEAVNKIMSDAK